MADCLALRYGQYCPVVKAAEILGDRWTMLIVRELLYEVHRFGEIERGLPGISRSLLARRLRQLEDARVIERRNGGGRRPEYWLTAAGADLRESLLSLGHWAERHFSRDPLPRELDSSLLLLWIKRHVRLDRLPARRVVVRFDLRGARRGTGWLVLERAGASVCDKDPGLDTDVVVSADTMALYQVYAGRITLGDALHRGPVALDGPSALVRGFGTWFGFSPFHATTRAAVA